MQHFRAESVHNAVIVRIGELVELPRIAILAVPKPLSFAENLTMSIDKSLRRKSGIARNRSVLTRDERIKVLMETERWADGRSPYNLPKVRVAKIVVKKAAKKEKAEGEAGGAAPAADAAKAPAAGAKAPAAPAAKPAAKADAKGGKK